MTDTATRIAGPQPTNHNSLNPTAAADTLPGTPMYASASGEADAARANAAGTSRVIGLASSNGAEGEPVHVQYAGPLDLPTAEWDVITGQSGGLTQGSYYYLVSGAAGQLTTTEPTAGGTFGIRVGLALSSTTMLIQIGDIVVNS